MAFAPPKSKFLKSDKDKIRHTITRPLHGFRPEQISPCPPNPRLYDTTNHCCYCDAFPRIRESPICGCIEYDACIFRPCELVKENYMGHIPYGICIKPPVGRKLELKLRR